MVKNYLLIAWRNLLRNRLFSFVNILSLALSMTVGMMVLIRLSDSLSYDRFHDKEERIFRVISRIENVDKNKWKLASTLLPLSEFLSRDSALLRRLFAYILLLPVISRTD